MIYKYEYKTQEERQALLDLYQGLVLIEEHNITEGSFLVFSDASPVPPTTEPSLESRVDLIEETIDFILMNGGV
mgnify:CR=1 FL=1